MLAPFKSSYTEKWIQIINKGVRTGWASQRFSYREVILS